MRGVTVRVPPNPASIEEFEPLGTLFALTRYRAKSKILGFYSSPPLVGPFKTKSKLEVL